MNERPILVLVHGHGVDASIWDSIYPELFSEFTVIRPDFSRLTSHDTVDAYAEHLYSLLQTAQVESCVVIGHSMGGYIALALAERHPELIRGLGLFHSTAFADDEPKKEQRRKAVLSLETGGAQPFIGATIPRMVGEAFRRRHETEVRELVSRYSSLPADALAAGIRAVAARPDRTQVLKEAPFPVLILAGKGDQLVQFDTNKALLEMAPQSTPVILEESGHLGMIEEAGASAEAIRSFVRHVYK